MPPPDRAPPDFAVTGKIGLKEASRGHSARFNWQQWGERYEVEVWGPLGQGRTALRGDLEQMLISRGDTLLAAGPPTDVMQSQLGWHVPLQVFPAWIIGSYAAEVPAMGVQRDAAGRLTQFEQAGWQIKFDRFDGETAAARPERIKAVSGARSITVIVAKYVE